MTNEQEITGKRTAENAINNGTGGRFIGYVVGANTVAGISQVDARAAASRHGIADDLGWPRLKSNNYYRRAVVGAVSSGKRDERRFEAVKVEETSLRIVHAIIRKDLVAGLLGSGAVVPDPTTGELRIASRDAKFDEEFKVAFDKAAFNAGGLPEDLIVYEDRARNHPLAAEIGRLYTAAHGTFTTVDIRAAFSRAFAQWDGIQLLQHAGMWFLPATREDRVRAWYAWMAEIGCFPVALRQRAGEDPMSDDSIARSSTSGITTQLATLEKELDEFAANDATRFRTLEERVSRFADLRRLAALHDELLGIRRASLQERLASAQTRWLGRLIEITEAEVEDPADDGPEPDAAEEDDA
jgi:hypothetical protein